MLTLTFLWAFLMMPMAEKCAQNGDHATSAKLLEFVDPSENPAKYYFLKAVNSYAVNDRKKTIAALEDFEFVANSTTPTRYRHVAALMAEEISRWNDSDLADIGRDMKHSADRLGSGRADGTTKKVQENIIAKLDKMIKDEQDQRNNKNKKKEETEEEAKRQIPGNDNAGADASSPKEESTIGGITGDGKVDPRDFRKFADKWGTLPESARAKVIADLQRELPPKYRQQIEAYQQALNRHRQ